MPGGSVDVDPRATLGENAAPVVVARYDAAAKTFEPLYNVVCESISYREGAEPGVARMRYLLDVIARAQGFPTEFEALWPLDAQGPGVVQPDDRLCVVSWTPEGDRRILFDGFAQIPQVDLSPGSQAVTFTCVSAEARCFDGQVGGRLQRDADAVNSAGTPVQTDLPTRFNPLVAEGVAQPNCTTPNHDENNDDASKRYPVFLDELLNRDPDPRAAWTLSGAVRYLMGTQNDQKYVDNPDFGNLDSILKAREPKGDKPVDPTNPDTYDEVEIPVRDYDATEQPWPAAVAALLAYAGFGFRFVCQTDSGGFPLHLVDLYRTDAAEPTAAKDLLLQPPPSPIRAGRNTAAQVHLARDLNAIVNAFSIETPPRRVECSIVLAPGFTPAVGDEAAANRTAFSSANLPDATTTVKNKYRLWIADETGEGHYDLAASAADATALDLRPIFPPKDDGKQSYVKRTRPGSRWLITRDDKGKRRPAALHVSRDYAGKAPAVWDGTGTWQPIAPGHGWRILEDRLGIYISCENPGRWTIGQQTGAATHEQSITLDAITSIANPAAPNTKFYLRLTTVLDDDIMLPAAVPARVSSPSKFVRRRRVDARDHYLLETIDTSSPYNTTGDAIVARDDTAKALAHGRQLRAAHEMPPLAGSVTIPWLTNAFEVGDRVKLIRGRDVSLRTNVGADQGEAPAYPRVVALTWSFAGDQQSTQLQLTDRRGEPARA